MAEHEKFAIDVDGELIVCTNGLVSGKRELVRAIKDAATLELPIQVTVPFGAEVPAGLGTGDPIRTLAALMHAAPGRCRILEAPAEVWAYFDEESREQSDGDGQVTVVAGADDVELED
ncbi:MAG: hypothetical protein WBK67_00985 [Minisyncoccales bacterium]